jgi:hypothetical protein
LVLGPRLVHFTLEVFGLKIGPMARIGAAARVSRNEIAGIVGQRQILVPGLGWL